ncbi:MAG: MATE family efflux transporter [Candidatus Aenigmarchaeota archaeon]|nr:MATE family efflux transporter [Candidatus Aenigmarchaeota archaeon]
MKGKNNPTEGSILKSLITLSVPIIFASILQSAYQLTDTFWVGRLGTDAIAAVSISFPIIFLIISLGGGLSIAGTILVAQYKGKKDKKAVNHIAGQTFLMVIIVSVILSALGYFLSPIFVSLMGVESNVFLNAVSYMKISFIGLIFMFTYMVFQSLMRGVGDVKTPLYIVFGTVLLNLILDPLFIFGYWFIPALGVAGAAVATILTQGISAVIGIIILLRGKHQIHLCLNNLKPDIFLLKKMFRLGFPASIEQSTRALGMIIMIFLVASFGTLTLAAYGIGGRILSFIVLPAIGLSMATSTLVGQNIGAGKMKRAEKIAKLSSLTGFIVLTLVGILTFFFAGQISAIFIPGELETIQATALFIKIMALTFGFIGLQMSLNGAFRGSGNTMIPLILSIISLWVLRFPIAYILSKHTVLAELGIWIAFPIANVIAAIITIVWFAKGTWKQKRLTKDIKLTKEVTKETIIEEGVS